MKPRGLVLLLLALLLAPNAALAQTTPPPAPPSCTITATPPTVTAGDRSRLQWTSKNASRGTLTVVGNISAAGSVYVTPSKTTEYTATFTGPGGTRTCTARVTVAAFGSGGSVDGTVVIPTTVAPADTVTPQQAEGPTEVAPIEVAPQTVNTGGFPTGGSIQLPSQTTSGGGILGGIVPAECTGKTGSIATAVYKCDFCSFGQLLQNIINWLLAMSILIAAGMFAYAGILMFTSAANISQREKAKKIFGNVALGFFLAIGGWLFIQTVLSALVRDQFFVTNMSKSWNTLDCAQSRAARQNTVNQSVGDWLRSALPGLSTVTSAPTSGVGANSNVICRPGSVVDPTGQSCQSCSLDAAGKEVCEETAPLAVNQPSSLGTGACSQENMAGIWGDNAAAASCVATKESNCNPALCGDNGASCGIYQINWTANDVTCNGEVLPCTTAVSAPYTGSNPRIQIKPGKEVLAEQCIATLKNPDCNAQTAVAIQQKNGWKPWSTARTTMNGVPNKNSCHLVP